MIKTSCIALLLFASTAFASSARAETPPPAKTLFDQCAAATQRFRAAQKTELDLGLLELAMQGAEKGDIQCEGLAQRVLLQHAKRLARLSALDRVRIIALYARAFAAWGTPELKTAQDKLQMIASAR